MRLALKTVLTGLAAWGALWAQTPTGSISGLVADSSGALVPGVSITVIDTQRNIAHRTQSNESGFYAVTQLAPGTYSIAAERQGFKKYLLEGFPLAVQQRATVNMTLEVGAMTESIQVTAETQLVEAGSSTLSYLMENKKILDLPLNGRNVFQMTALVPGVFYARQLGGPDESQRGSQFSVNGGQLQQTEIMVDGVTATASDELSSLTATTAIPSIDGLQEFRIQTSAYSAEYGRTGGGIVTMVTKSGTNELHGSLFYYHRNSALDANSFFANRSGRALQSFKRHQYGASAGGPVVIPGVYNGKNRTFLFGLYEGMRRMTPLLVRNTVPTDAERQGDFSKTLNTAGQVRIVYNPFSTRVDPANPGKSLRDPLAGNRLPSSLMDAVAQNVQKYLPAPNDPGDALTGTNNFVYSAGRQEPHDRYELKVDHSISSSQRMFVRYSRMDYDYGNPNVWGNPANPGY